MATVETTLNKELADILDRRSCWNALPEQTGELEDGGQIDVLILERGWPHVIIECKVGMKPEDVDKRFDNRFTRDGTVPSIIFEVKYPVKLRGGGGDLGDSKLKYCVWHGKHARFPRSGWLEGTAYDLAADIQYSRESEGYKEGSKKLHDAAMACANIMNNLSDRIKKRISCIMEQKESMSTYATAALVVAGALRFHDTAAEPSDVELIGNMADDDGYINVTRLAPAWKKILDDDYYPIFSSARQIIGELPDHASSDIVRRLYHVNGELGRINLSNSSDLYGQTYQRIISDRKKLAAFYTKPPSAALLAAVSVPDDLHDSESLRDVHIADFACGSGTLLHTAYRMLAANYEMYSGRPMVEMHPHMMANCLIGADVLPVATHLTAAVLSSMYPKQSYDQTCIFQPKQGTADHKIGSLEWIREDAKLDESETRLTGIGEQGTSTQPGHGSCHAVIMNPPYSRSQGPGGRADEDEDGDNRDPVQLFTAFGASDSDRRKMGERATNLFKPPKKTSVRRIYCANKNAGLGTFFMDLAHAKLRRGGRLGLILPMTAATGINWKKFRQLIESDYTDIIVFSGRFSADTGMKEIIVSCRKIEQDENPSDRGIFISLDRPIDTVLEGIHIGREARNLSTLQFENRLQGGTRILVGGDEVGSALDCPLQYGWNTVDAFDFTLHQTVQYLRHGNLYLPHMRAPLTIGTTTLSEIADMGKSHLQIRGGKAQPGRTTSYSGPFNLREYRPGCRYPTLWNNHNMVQRQMTVSPDHALEPRPGCDGEKVEEVWKTRSNIHMNITTDTTSQALMMSYTQKPVVGGRSWPSVITKRKYTKGLAVWCNSTLGILCRWAISNHQQIGRSTTSHTALRDLLVPTPINLTKISDVFDGFAQKKFDRIMNLWKDPVRIRMDTQVLERLGIRGVDLDNLRKRLCLEPSIYGKKSVSDLKSALENGR